MPVRLARRVSAIIRNIGADLITLALMLRHGKVDGMHANED